MANDIRMRSLDWLYRNLKDMRLALANLEQQHKAREDGGPCLECQIRDVREHIEEIDWLIARALEGEQNG